MNNDLKYIVRGCLWVTLLFISVSVIKFCFSHNYTNQDTEIVVDYTDSIAKPTSSEGKTLFMNNCASCHALNKTLVGPGLKGVTQRIPDKKLLYAWIRNNKAVLKSGDPYFNALYKSYDKIQMTTFPNLTDDQIDKILAYINTESLYYSLPTPVASK